MTRQYAAPQAETVDTTGANDAFTATLAAPMTAGTGLRLRPVQAEVGVSMSTMMRRIGERPARTPRGARGRHSGQQNLHSYASLFRHACVSCSRMRVQRC